MLQQLLQLLQEGSVYDVLPLLQQKEQPLLQKEQPWEELHAPLYGHHTHLWMLQMDLVPLLVPLLVFSAHGQDLGPLLQRVSPFQTHREGTASLPLLEILFHRASVPQVGRDVR